MIKSYCSECDAQSIDGVMKHAKNCLAHMFIPQTGTAIMPPGITLKFDSIKEQEDWLENLKGGSFGSAPTPAQEVGDE